MKFTFEVTVEVERDEGKFASREDIGGQLTEAIEQADPGSLGSDNGGQYSVTSWEVSETT